MPKKVLLFCIIVLYYLPGFSQNFHNKGKITWRDYDVESLLEEAKIFAEEDLVILDERVSFTLALPGASRIQKHMLISINSRKGLEKISSMHLPEPFDPYDISEGKQGYWSKHKTPYVEDFTVHAFAVRQVLSARSGTINAVFHPEKFKRLYTNGDAFVDQSWRFDLMDLRVGDVIELYYSASFESDYKENLFYFHSDVPKLHATFAVQYNFNRAYAQSGFTRAENIPDSLVTTLNTPVGPNEICQVKTVTLHHLAALNYPRNSFAGGKLPHLYVDLSVWLRYVNRYTGHAMKAAGFEWMFVADTVNNFVKAYTSHYAGISRFAKNLPPTNTNSDADKEAFLSALCDSFNNCRYISSRDLFLKESHLINIYRGDHLLKRRIIQNQVYPAIKDILNERRLFYYMVRVPDGRFAHQKSAYHIHQKYESALFALPLGNTIVYLMPRYFGVKYFVNELPYYFEGNYVALMGRNFTEEMSQKLPETIRFAYTPSGDQNTNTRSETAMFRISRDSLKAEMNGKLNLSGQFSTLLRHLYFKDCIDSSAAPHYFRRCTDKPGVTTAKVVNTGSARVFPFRQAFTASASLKLASHDTLSLRQWFSFPLAPALSMSEPKHDYYFDFLFTDSYNFSLEFSEPVNLSNVAEFTKKLSNDYFSLESELTEISDKQYLVRVRIAVKQKMVPLKDLHYLSELAKTLDSLNSFSLLLSKRA